MLTSPDTTVVSIAATDTEPTVRARLEELYDEFMEASIRLSNLRYTIFPYPSELSQKQIKPWRERLKKQHVPAEVHRWEDSPLGNTIGLFWLKTGEQADLNAAYDRFVELGTTAYRIFAEIDETLPDDDADRGWLNMLWEMSFKCPVDFLKQESGLWGHGPDLTEDEFCTLVAAGLNEGEAAPPTHSCYVTHCHDVFTVSAAAIEMFLKPYECRFLEDTPELTPWLLQAVFANRDVLNLTASETCRCNLMHDIVGINHVAIEKASRPYWNGVCLSYRGHETKKPKANADDCIQILNAFEFAGWPKGPVKSPLIARGLKHPILDQVYERTRKAHYNLNQNQKGPFRLVFRSEHAGKKSDTLMFWNVVFEE